MSYSRTSTSTSTAAPTANLWNRIWLLSIGLFAIAFLTAELLWRSMGYYPSTVDSPERWATWYEYACNGETKSIALIGSSRMQAGLSAEQLRQRLPGYRVSQLGRNGGGSPVGVLRAIADDRRFRGIVICDMLTPFLPRTEWDKQEAPEPAVDAVDWSARIDRAVSNCLSDSFAIRSYETGLVASVREILRSDKAPQRESVLIRADRSLVIDFQIVGDLKAYAANSTSRYRRRYEEATHPMPNELDDEVQEIAALVRKIQARGGLVVFLQMPTSGDMRAMESKYHPKTAYWDRFASIEGAGLWIHWTDLSSSDAFSCPDESHLDEAGAVRFADALVDELIARNIFSELSAAQN